MTFICVLPSPPLVLDSSWHDTLQWDSLISVFRRGGPIRTYTRREVPISLLVLISTLLLFFSFVLWLLLSPFLYCPLPIIPVLHFFLVPSHLPFYYSVSIPLDFCFPSYLSFPLAASEALVLSFPTFNMFLFIFFWGPCNITWNFGLLI